MTFTLFTTYILAAFIVLIPLIGLRQKIDIFDSFLTGGKKGFDVIIKIVPAIVGMYVAIGMLRASGFFEIVTNYLSPLLEQLGIPASILPLMLLRPISGAGTIALFAETIEQYGPNSIDALTSATILGSTETTFYVIAVYFGAIGIRRYRYAIGVGLLADLAGVIASIAVCKMMFGF